MGLTKFQVGDIIIVQDKGYTKISKILMIDYRAKMYQLKVLACNKKQYLTYMGIESVAEQRAEKLPPELIHLYI
jgi:hypothetical protein